MDRVTEKKLIIAAQRGSPEAFEQLYNEYRMELYKSALLIMRKNDDAEDAVSETFIKAFKSIDRFDTRYPMRPWLHQILSNECSNIFKRTKSDVLQLDDFSTDWKESVVDREVGTDESIIEDDESAKIRDMIDKLSFEHRQVVTLHYFQCFDINAISSILSVPVGTVKSRLFHARKQLAKIAGINEE